MTITKEWNGTALTICLEGKLDTTSAPHVEETTKEDTDKAESAVVDLEKVQYISSAGLRFLLSLHKKMAAKGGLKILHVNETNMEIFDLTGFTDILTIE